MRFKTKILAVTGLVAAMVIVVILATRPPKHEPEQPQEPESTPGEQAVTTEPRHTTSSPEQPQVSVAPNTEPQEASETTTNVIANWEEKIDEVLKDTSESDEKAKKILAIFPRLPEEGQVEAAKHISNLLPDENYAQISKYVTDPALPSEVLNEFVADLLNRPDSIKLPTLLEIARNTQHPEAVNAKDILELYLEEDYGDNWELWQQKLAQWLKDNPD